MKIIQISYELTSGGRERFVVDLCNRLARNEEDEVILLTCDDDRIPKNVHYLNDLSENVRFINLHAPRGHHPKSFWGIYKIIKKERPDIVHAHCGTLMIYLPAFMINNVHYVHTLHTLAQKNLEYKWCKYLNRFFYSRYILPITISKACHNSYMDLYGKSDDVCIINGREPLNPSGIMPKEIDFIQDEKPVFIHVARCAVPKNQQRLFNCFNRLTDEGVGFHLIVLGSNYEEQWMPIYQNHPQIHIVGERKNVADYMAYADYFVLSSDYEGLPLTLLEAMSLGVIPISTPAGGVPEVILDGRNGYLSKSFDDDDFYKKIKQALSEKGKLNKELIKKEYEDNYSMKNCAQKYYSVYKELLK